MDVLSIIFIQQPHAQLLIEAEANNRGFIAIDDISVTPGLCQGTDIVFVFYSYSLWLKCQFPMPIKYKQMRLFSFSYSKWNKFGICGLFIWKRHMWLGGRQCWPVSVDERKEC